MTNRPAPLIFIDTETTGLLPDDHIWELAAIRREPDGTEEIVEVLVEHDLSKAARLPESFRADHDARYRSSEAVAARHLVGVVHFLCRSDNGAPYAERPHIVGAVPSFDTARLDVLMRHHGIAPNWHHHIQDVETLALGYVAAMAREYPGSRFADYIAKGVPPIDSDELSALIGVDPEKFERHTAMGDVRWSMAIWDCVTGGAE